MRIVTRSDEPWDELFLFHSFSSEGDDMVGKKLKGLISKGYRLEVDHEKPISVGERNGETQILGRFLKPKERLALLSQWNEPDGSTDFMCYTPNHGIATVRNGKLDWWTLVCFQCQNAGIAGPLALSAPAKSSRNLPEGRLLADLVDTFLPERPFPISM